MRRSTRTVGPPFIPRKITGVSEYSGRKCYYAMSGRVGDQSITAGPFTSKKEAAKEVDRHKVKEYYSHKKEYDEQDFIKKLQGNTVQKGWKIPKPYAKSVLLNFPEDYPDEDFGSYHDTYLKKQKKKKDKKSKSEQRNCNHSVETNQFNSIQFNQSPCSPGKLFALPFCYEDTEDEEEEEQSGPRWCFRDRSKRRRIRGFRLRRLKAYAFNTWRCTGDTTVALHPRQESASVTLINLVDQIKNAMGYCKGINLPNTLSKAISDLEIETKDQGAQKKANCIAEYLGIQSRCG